MQDKVDYCLLFGGCEILPEVLALSFSFDRAASAGTVLKDLNTGPRRDLQGHGMNWVRHEEYPALVPDWHCSFDCASYTEGDDADGGSSARYSTSAEV